MGRKKVIPFEESLAYTHPELCEEWDYEKNDKGPEKYTAKSSEKVWWKCRAFGDSWETGVRNRAILGSNCPYCTNQKANHRNSLSSLRPDIAKEWNPDLNDKTPDEVTYGSGYKAWWTGSECGHTWNTTVRHRTTAGTGCPYCSCVKLLVGFNDMWTTNPELASSLFNPEDGYKYMQYSNKNVYWSCIRCGNKFKRKILNTHRDGIACTACTDGFSFPEKFFYLYLKKNNYNFEPQKVFSWSKNKRYDFHIPEQNLIVEIHGAQHYPGHEGFFSFENGRSFEEEQQNDKEKKMLAIENGIEKYLVIDARASDSSIIAHQINETKFLLQLNETDRVNLDIEARKNSLILDAVELYNKNYETKEIAKELKVGKGAIVRYLKIANDLGLCVYCSKTATAEKYKKMSIEVVQLSVEGEYIATHNSMRDAARATTAPVSGIGSVCKGRYKTSGGFKWMYKEDYDKMSANQQKEIS